MDNGDKKLSIAFADLSASIDRFIEEVNKKKARSMATDEWTVKEVLAHLTSWHMNYAANYRAMVNKQPPPLLKGPGYRINSDGVASLKRYSREKLIRMLKEAHKDLEKSILVHKIPNMKYRQQGQIYTTHKFLTLVNSHFRTHTKHVQRAKDKNSK